MPADTTLTAAERDFLLGLQRQAVAPSQFAVGVKQVGTVVPSGHRGRRPAARGLAEGGSSGDAIRVMLTGSTATCC